MNVQIRATNEFDHGTFLECRGASVQICIVPTVCGDTHVSANVLCQNFAQETGFLCLIAKVEQTLQV